MNSEVEIWKAIEGFEGLYSVSNRGRVRSERRQVRGKLGSVRTLPQAIRRASLDGSGYLQLALSRDGVPVMRKVHVLVAKAFIGPRPEGHEVAHSDGEKVNCSASNLRYATPTENQADRLLHGTAPRGNATGRAKLTPALVLAIRKDRRSERQIAKELGVSHCTVGDVKRGVSWFYV